MPTSDGILYGFKYVNGHPRNTEKNKLTVMATGQLSIGETGEPLLFTEMTLLTAFRTACSAAMAAKYLARKNSKSIAIIGTGAQSEFQFLAFKSIFPISDVYYYDLDEKAMEKFANNIKPFNVNLHPCKNIEQTVEKADIIVTLTANKERAKVLDKRFVKAGVFIAALGGDAPGKTELDEELVKACKVVVEYTPQTLIEGEVQKLGKEFIYAELWEIMTGKKQGRGDDNEITIFDSVGFAIEDFSVLRLVYDLAKEHNIGNNLELIPELKDPKNLFSSLK
jgi:ornithine cyclodeaminase